MEKILEIRNKISTMATEAETLLERMSEGSTPELDEKYDGIISNIKELRAQEKRYIEIYGVQDEIKKMGKREAVDDDAEVKPPEAEKRFASMGEQLRAVIAAEVSKMTDVDSRLDYRQMGMSEGVPGDGGFLVQTDFSTELLRNTYETGILANRVRRQPIGPNSNAFRINMVNENNRATGARMGGIQAFWTPEAGQKQDSHPTFRQMEMTLQKLTGLLYATDELLADTTALEAFIGQAFAEEFGFMVDDAIIQGTGVGQPLGILNSPALVTQAAEAGQPAGTIVYENLTNMWSRLPARSRRNAIWLVNQECEPELDNLSIAAGTAALEPRFVNYGNDGVMRIKGRPVVAIEQANALGLVGDMMLVDLQQYLMIEKGMMESASSIHVRFIWDESTFRFVYRCNGQPLWNQPLTPYQGANQQSPFVALAARP